MSIEIEIPQQVVARDGSRHTVLSVTLRTHDQERETHEVDLPIFLDTYEEYVDPKDVEIQRLRKELEALKAKHKPTRKKKRTLTPAERAEVYTLIINGEKNDTIAEQYGISVSSASRLRKTMPEGFLPIAVMR